MPVDADRDVQMVNIWMLRLANVASVILNVQHAQAKPTAQLVMLNYIWQMGNVSKNVLQQWRLIKKAINV